MAVTTIIDPLSGRQIFTTDLGLARESTAIAAIIVADITARNATTLAQKKSLIWVVDATGDATVTSGGAMYCWNPTGSTWVKIAEAESMDVTPGGGDSNLTNVTNDAQVKRSEMAVALGVATLDSDSKVVQNIAASHVVGVLDIANIPAAALERLVIVADDATRYALTTATAQLGDVVKVTETGLTYFVTDDDNLDSSAGYTEFTVGTAAAVPWSGISDKPAHITEIAGLTLSNDDILQQKAGVLTNRTMAQLKTDLSLGKSDVGLSSVTNDAQIKKAASSTNGVVPKWNGTTGDELVDGFTVGTSAGNLVQLDSEGKLPALDASLLTNLPSGGGSAPADLTDRIVRSEDAASLLEFAQDGALVQAYLKDVGSIDSNAKVVLGFETATLPTDIVDESNVPNTITYVDGGSGNNISIVEGGKFGTKAIHIPGGMQMIIEGTGPFSDYIRLGGLNTSYLPHYGSAATWEFHFKPDSDMPTGSEYALLEFTNHLGNALRWSCTYCESYAGNFSGIRIGGTGWVVGIGYSVAQSRTDFYNNMRDGNWHHLAITELRYAPYSLIPAQDDIPAFLCDGSPYYLMKVYIDGIKLPGYSLRWGDYSTDNVAAYIPCYTPGNDTGSTPNFPIFKGKIDNLRFSNVMRYSGNFTPPDAPFSISQIKEFRIGDQTIPELETRMMDTTKSVDTLTVANNNEVPMFITGVGGINNETMLAIQVDTTGSTPVAKDYSPFNSTLTKGSAITYIAIDDLLGYGIVFDGTANSKISIPALDTARLFGNIVDYCGPTITFEFWMKSSKTSGNQYILSTDDTNLTVAFTVRTVNGALQLSIGSGFSDGSWGFKNTQVCDDNWHHIRVQMTSISGVQRIYYLIDGINISTYESGPIAISSTGKFQLGIASAESFVGVLADIRFQRTVSTIGNYTLPTERYTSELIPGKYLTAAPATLTDIELGNPYKSMTAKSGKAILDHLQVPATLNQQLIQDQAINFDQTTDIGKVLAITGTAPVGNDSKTKILLHFANDSYLDSSINNATPTYVPGAYSNTTVYTASGKFTGGMDIGGAMDGSNYLAYDNIDKRYDRRGDWCIDFWYKSPWADPEPDADILIFGCGVAASHWRIDTRVAYDGEYTAIISRIVKFTFGGLVVSCDPFADLSININDGTFRHFLLAVNNNVWQWYINGVPCGTPVTSATLTDVGGRLLFGGHDQFTATSFSVQHTIDELRISSTYRQNADFSTELPASEYVGGTQEFHVSALSFKQNGDNLELRIDKGNGTFDLYTLTKTV